MQQYISLIILIACFVPIIIAVIYNNKRYSKIIDKIINETATLTAKKVLEALHPASQPQNTMGASSEEIMLKEINGINLVEFVLSAKSGDNVKCRESSGAETELIHVYTIPVEGENGKKDVYAVMHAAVTDNPYIAEVDECAEHLILFRANENADGSTYLNVITDFHIMEKVYTEFLKMTGASEDKIESSLKQMRANYEALRRGTATQKTVKHGFSSNEKASALPDSKWFASNGIKLKEIPIEKKALKNLSYNEKCFIALSTYPTLKRNTFIILGMACVLIAALLIGGLLIRSIEFMIIAVIIFAAGSFVVQKLFGVLDGFNILNGSSLIKMPIGINILYHIAYPVGGLWGAISQMVFIMLDSMRRQKMLGLPRVVMPQNCGFDEFIDFYSEYEAQCNLADAKRQHDAHQRNEEYQSKQKAAAKMKKSAASDEKLTSSQKQTIINEANSVIKKNKEIYENEIKPDL